MISIPVFTFLHDYFLLHFFVDNMKTLYYYITVCLCQRPCPMIQQNHDIKALEVLSLANIKSAKKRILVNQKKAAKNKAVRSKVKTAIKKVDAAVLANDKASAQAALKACIIEIDKAMSKGIYHKNTASRKISRLTLAVNKIA